MHHIHSKGFCHLDLKAESIYLDHNLNVKIGDFRYSELYENDVKSFKGTPYYQAPEIKFQKYL